MTPVDAALAWIKRGFSPVPVPYRSKRPVLDGWQRLEIKAETAPRYFKSLNQNVGVLLGDKFGSADVDCDCPEAITAARVLLPETGLIFGRASKPFSHFFYRSDPPVRTCQFHDPLDHTTLVELRGLSADGTIGLQTVVPSSVHDTGEQIRFEESFDRAPAKIDADVLLAGVQKVAAATLFARHWPANGAQGWAFADVLPVFKKQEDWEGGANEWRGSGGPIHIRRPKDPHPIAPAFIEAAREMGMPILDDLNGPMDPGAGYINMNIAADGTRVSAVRAFLRPALSRPNLTLSLNTDVVKLNFKGTRCVGVKLLTGDEVRDIAVDKEVILAAGTIHSSKLLMLSGVGEANALRSLGIDLVENLPGVGQNLQDHVLLSGVVFKYKGKMPDRPADSNAVEAEAYLSSGPSGDTDISLVPHQLPVVTPEVASRFGSPSPDAFTIAAALVQPTSRGSVRLASTDFQDAVVIDGNYLGTDRDFAAIVSAIEAARELGNQHAFDSLRKRELIPGPKAGAGEIRELARLASASFGHAVGTCKMGVDKLAVVDPELRVHGILGLRVADASVMPQIITGPGTNASAHMIAGRAAELILG